MDNQESLLDEVIAPESADENTIHTDLPETEIQLALEAVLFSVNEPISVSQLRRIFDQEVSGHIIRQQLNKLRQFYDQHGRSFQLTEIANGWQINTRAKSAGQIEKFHTRQVRVRLSPSALEALAIVAYKQPVTRTEIE